MEHTVVFNGASIHIGYIAINSLWVLLSLIVGGLLLTQVYRLSVLSKSTKNPRKYHGLRVQWAHAAAIWVCILIVGVDVSHVYFDESFYFASLFGEIVVLTLNMYIFYFFTHVETYIISNKSLDIPDWLPRTRLYWLIINTVVGNALNVATYVSQRFYLKYMVHGWVGVQTFCLAFVLGGVAWQLTQTVARVFEKQATTEESNAGGPLRKFKMTSVMSTLMGIFYGVVLIAQFLVQFTTIDPETRFPVARDDRPDFEFFWFKWLAYLALIYTIKLFWIPKTVFDASRRMPQQSGGGANASRSAGANKSGSSANSGTLSRAATPDPFASPYKKSLHSASARISAGARKHSAAASSISRGSAVSYISVRTPRAMNVRRSLADPQDAYAAGAEVQRSSRRGSASACSIVPSVHRYESLPPVLNNLVSVSTSGSSPRYLESNSSNMVEPLGSV